jgi:hypothetical protein
MKRNGYIYQITWGMSILIFAASFAACQSASTPVSLADQVTGPASNKPGSVTLTQEVLPGPTLASELTYEEMRNTTPPAPLDFRLTTAENSVRLDWSLPPPVEIPHQYSDVIIHYNVYRRTGNQAGTQLIAATENLFYVDASVTKGMIYSYSVSAVHEGPLEGERTDELFVTFP